MNTIYSSLDKINGSLEKLRSPVNCKVDFHILPRYKWQGMYCIQDFNGSAFMKVLIHLWKEEKFVVVFLPLIS